MSEIAEGINGEVYPCPECERHDTVKWLPGEGYRYHCTDCDNTFTRREAQ